MSSETPNPTPPLVTDIWTADPSAHSFDGRLYVYPSHDRETPIQFNDKGDQYDMVDYHVLSMDKVGSKVTDHGVALKVEDIPWVSKQLWAPDAFKGQDGRYWLCFPARDSEGVFRLGLAHSDKPEGPFTPHAKPIPKSFTIDPATFVDKDGSVYAYFGGIWGGQLQCYSDPEGTKFDPTQDGPHEPTGQGVYALCPRVAKMAYEADAPAGEAYGAFAEAVREVVILDPSTGRPLLADDHDKRFFEASWMHEKDGVYYFSYSTGDSHFIAYASGDNPYGPFTYRGTILPPVVGWTTHHSIVKHDERWWLFYHDCERSDGVSHLRSVRVRELWYDAEGNISIEKP